MGINSILFFPFAVLEGVIAILVGILIFAFWLWMIIDCAGRKFRNNLEKIIWIFVMIFTTWIGALVYYFAIRQSNPKGLAKR